MQIVWTQKILLDPKDFGPKKYFWTQNLLGSKLTLSLAQLSSRIIWPKIKQENQKMRCSEVHLTRTLELRCSEVHLMHEVHEVHEMQ